MKNKQVTIPVFIPMQACPFHCIYCDQQKITGRQELPGMEQVTQHIQTYLSTIPKGKNVEAGFFGGTFTGLPENIQEKYLRAVEPFIRSGRINSIRLSTRPDFIDEQVLNRLKKFHVSTIELGAQSMDDEVLKKSGRGHGSQDTVLAASLIKAAGFRLGLQMMTGLPGDSPAKSLKTAKGFIGLGASDVRIYPTLVIKGTALEKLFRNGKYRPLSLEQAVERTANLMELFLEAGVNVIRTGLHPSDGLLNGSDLVAGPFHVAFGELVMTQVWKNHLAKITLPEKVNIMEIFVPQNQLNFAIGHRGSNRKWLGAKAENIKIKPDSSLTGQQFNVDYC